MARKRNRKVFIPRSKPRYLKYQVGKRKMDQDLELYNIHLKNVFEATCHIDAKPLKMNLKDYVDFSKMNKDLDRAYQVDRENKEMLRKICIIDRKGGVIHTINPHAFECASKWDTHAKKMLQIEERNKYIHKRLNDSQSYYQRKDHAAHWKHFQASILYCSRYPFTINKRKSLDETLRAQPSISGLLPKIAHRPLCYLEFKVDEGEHLGRVIIELYHDHVPVTVQNFLEICRGDNDNLTYKKCLVHRIVKGRYLETGDITKGTGSGGFSIYGETFDEENHMLKHTKAGVLSMVRGRNQKNDSKFCITLSSMEELDRKNVVFGKVIQGATVLTKINGYGRCVGKPLVPIRITACGGVCTCDS